MSENDLNPAESPASNSGRARVGVWTKRFVLLAGALLTGLALHQFGGPATAIDRLVESESALRELQAQAPLLMAGAAFLVYALVTGLAIPGAALLTLVVGWFFGPVVGTVIVSLASTTGATISFLLSRHLARDFVQRRFGEYVRRFDEAIEREGAFYLFTLRLVPAVPFFVVNAVMGLTRLRTTTYWWVSQLGMLPATMVYVYAGSRIPNLETLANEGAGAVFTGLQLLQLTGALCLLGVFPLVVKKIVDRVRPRNVETTGSMPAVAPAELGAL